MTTTALVPSAKFAQISDSRLDRHATRIRELMTDMANNSLALGRELVSSKKYFKSLKKKGVARRWSQWVDAEFGLNDKWASALMRASSGANRANKHLAVKVIGLITSQPASSAHAKAIAEIKGRIKGGEPVSERAAQSIVRKHKHGGNGSKMPSPSEAKEIAAKHHIIVAASDGRLYTGASEEAVKEATDKRAMVYGVRRALETLANVPMNADEFLKYADPHQLWTKDEEWVLAKALTWLGGLIKSWGIIDVKVG